MMTKAPFEAVVADHGATVLRVCRAVLGSHTDAEDAWSETFLSALKAYPELPAESNVRGWLVTIAHRKAIDVTRARARHAIPTADLPERAGSDLEPPDASVWRAVRSLPPRQREVITYTPRSPNSRAGPRLRRAVRRPTGSPRCAPRARPSP